MSAFASISRLATAPEDIHADVWHAHTLAHPVAAVLPSGDLLLDAQLPGGGWPVGALIELLQAEGVHSEWRLLLPALARSGRGAVALVGAPHVPFAPALQAQGLAWQRLLAVGAQGAAARLWSTEQLLRCADVDAVLAWLPQARSDQLRRLQMAASEYHKLLFVMRPQAAQREASPALLRLQIAPQGGTDSDTDTLQIHILKRRGPLLDAPLHLHARNAGLASLLAAANPPQPRVAPFNLLGVQHALDRTAACA
jgi:protein ImuA